MNKSDLVTCVLYRLKLVSIHIERELLTFKWAADSVQFRHSVVSDSLQPHGMQHTRLPCPELTQTHIHCVSVVIQPSHPLSSLSPSFNLSQHQGLFKWKDQFFTSGGQSIGVSASAPALPMNIQDWFPLGWTGWISLQSKGLSRVFSNSTVQKHQFFGSQLSL